MPQMPVSPTIPPSLWAAVTPSLDGLAPLDGSMTADVVVIGGGFTGLSAALHLRERGVDVVVLEAVEPGWGASGRNNGQVIPTLTRPEPADIIARHGAAGERFVHLIRDSAGGLFDLVRRYTLAAEAEQTGWIQPVHTPGRMKIAERRVAQWSRHGADVRLLSREEVRTLTGSDVWHGGWTAPSGGHVNPLALSREIARAVVANGGRIFVRTPASGYVREASGCWRVDTPSGSVRARALILATNAYTGEISRGLASEIASEVVPVLSWQMATAPVSHNIASCFLPGRQAMSDTHGDLHFARWDARNRLVTGGALMVAANGADRLRQRIGARIARWSPMLAELKFDFVWNGYVGMTTDFMPRFHLLGPDAWGWTGCNGRAVGLAIAIGRELARAATGERLDALGLPFSEPKPLPLHRLVRRAAPLRLVTYRWRDSREI